MQIRATVGPRGTVTIPVAVRRAYGLKAGDTVAVEPAEHGILLRPAVCIPLAIYSEERIAEFASDEQEIGRLLRGRLANEN